MILKRTRIFHVLLGGFKINPVIFSCVIKCMISVLAIWSIDPLCNMISVWECPLIPHATVLLIWTKESLMWQNHFFGFLILSTLGSLSKRIQYFYLFKLDITAHLMSEEHCVLVVVWSWASPPFESQSLCLRHEDGNI